MAAIPRCHLQCLLLLVILHPTLTASLSDAEALVLLKSSFKNSDTALSSWSSISPASRESTISPCGASSSSPPWTGVLCLDGVINALRLGGLGLSGSIDIAALSHFPSLRSISFINNNFTGPLPHFGTLDALKSIYLSNNRFSGPIPDGLFSSMDHLKKLWLDGNALSGSIPSSLSKASSLMELHLEGNAFTGVIPSIDLPSLRSLNVSHNNLRGPVPPSLARFDSSAFAGNAGLCGPPLPGPTCPTRPSPKRENNGGNRVLLILGGAVIVFLALVIGYAAVRGRRRTEYADSVMKQREAVEVEEAMEAAAAASPVKLPAAAASLGHGNKQQHGMRGSRRGSGSGGGAELVMVSEEKGVFGLPDLMRAAAEIVGNGGMGSVYKVVMANGAVVAVKRMREVNRLSREAFDGELRRLGRLRHPNLLKLLAYHFRKEEKLVVSEYIPKGSLLYILHGDRGEDHAALDWPTRRGIILGITRAMSYLHAELSAYDLPHGNLKTANVLLAADFQPLLADYGLAALATPSAASSTLFAYTSPEAHRHVSPQSDVYCFGLVLLEILTGKFPSQYLHNAKGGTDVVQWAAIAVSARREADIVDPQIAAGGSEVIRLLRVGAACTRGEPEERPSMREAADMVEKIAAAGEGWAGKEAAARRSESFGDVAPQWRGGLIGL